MIWFHGKIHDIEKSTFRLVECDFTRKWRIYMKPFETQWVRLLRLLKQFQMNQNNLSGFHKSIFFCWKIIGQQELLLFATKCLSYVGGSQNNYFKLNHTFSKLYLELFRYLFGKEKKEINVLTKNCLAIRNRKYQFCFQV